MQPPSRTTTLIIIGATGDLATKNLIPALYELFVDRPDLHFSVIAVAHNTITAQQLLTNVRPFLARFDEKQWDIFIEKISFVTADITDAASYTTIWQTLNAIEQSKPGNRIVYCACPPQLLIALATTCVEQGIIVRQQPEKSHEKSSAPFHAIIFEKPFGTNLETATLLNDTLKKLLSEHQIVRADHYLAKELVENIAYVRFTNEIFEPLWNRDHIASVTINLQETVTVEQRAQLYDTLGVVRDVIQSHALQLLTLTAMEAPDSLERHALETEKSAVLKHIRITHALFGQYTGYRTHTGVQPQSTTPTYALITCMIDTPRWQGVPFIIQAGKGLDTHTTEIVIRFKPPACKLASGCPRDSNTLTINIAPRSEFDLAITIKKPDGLKTTRESMPIHLTFCYRCMWPYTPQAYRVILQESIQGTESAWTLSVPFLEIQESWRLVDPLLKKDHPNVLEYAVGSSGPAAAQEYLKTITHNELL